MISKFKVNNKLVHEFRQANNDNIYSGEASSETRVDFGSNIDREVVEESLRILKKYGKALGDEKIPYYLRSYMDDDVIDLYVKPRVLKLLKELLKEYILDLLSSFGIDIDKIKNITIDDTKFEDSKLIKKIIEEKIEIENRTGYIWTLIKEGIDKIFKKYVSGQKEYVVKLIKEGKLGLYVNLNLMDDIDSARIEIRVWIDPKDPPDEVKSTLDRYIKGIIKEAINMIFKDMIERTIEKSRKEKDSG